MNLVEIFNALRFFISDGLLLVFAILVCFGLWGMIRFRSTFGKILNSSKLDSVAAIILMLALILRAGSFGTAIKVAAALTFYLLTNPVVNQLIAYAAMRQATEDQHRLESEGRL